MLHSLCFNIYRPIMTQTISFFIATLWQPSVGFDTSNKVRKSSTNVEIDTMEPQLSEPTLPSSEQLTNHYTRHIKPKRIDAWHVAFDAKPPFFYSAVLLYWRHTAGLGPSYNRPVANCSATPASWLVSSNGLMRPLRRKLYFWKLLPA